MTLEERFWAKVEKSESGCWLWTASLDIGGYAKLGIGDGVWKRAHRIAYEMFIGAIPPGTELHHKCKFRHCVNPDHLEAVTKKRHKAIHGNFGLAATNASKTHCPQGHPLYGENVYTPPGRAGRWCRTCRRIYAREAWRKKNWPGYAST